MTRPVLQRLGLIVLGAMLALGIGARAACGAAAERPTEAVDPANCLNSDCHTEVTDYATIHGPVGDHTCDACHRLANAEKHTFEFTREKEKMCTYCHEFDTGMLPVVHRPVMSGECLGCHNPHGGADRSFTREATISDTCGRCHESVTHGRDFLHDPAEKGECTNCHRPHASKFPNLLDAVGNGLCYSCHEDFGEEMGRVAYRHEAVDVGCVTCHDPHGSDFPMEVTQSIASLCLGCHDDIRQDTLSTYEHPAVLGQRSCLTCHTPHGGNLASLMCDSPVRMCMDCHDQTAPKNRQEQIAAMVRISDPTRFQHTPVREGQCGGCHTIHGGEKALLLREEYSTRFYQGFSEEKYGLCFSCHDEHMLDSKQANDLTSFRDGNLNLHYVHVVEGEVGRNCRTCHGVHTSTYQALIRDRVPFGDWEMATTFQKTETGATCMTGCHPPQSYDRVHPVGTGEVAASEPKSPRVPRADKDQPVVVRWSGADIHGVALSVPSADRASVLLFLRPGQVQSLDLVKMVAEATPQIDDAQVFVAFSGPGAIDDAYKFEQEKVADWPVVADTDLSLARSLGVDVWPATLIVQNDGTVIAHNGGASPSLTIQLAAYLDLAAKRIDRVALKERLSEFARVADTPEKRAEWHLQMGQKLLEQGSAEEARALFADGLKLLPDSAELQAGLAGALITLKQANEAMKILDKIPAGALPDAEINMLRARAEVARGQWERARAAITVVLEESPNLAEAHYLMGTIYEHDKNWEKAAEEYRKASQK